jgi:uncharacterized protein involved in copper resistance
MAQRKSIAGAIKQAAHGAAAVTESAPEPRPQAEPRSFKASTREGKKMIAAPIDPAAHRQLKMLAAELGLKIEDLIREALRDMFTKHGKPPIA